MKWSVYNRHCWVSTNQNYIQRFWILVGVKTRYYMVFKTKEDFHSGNNFATVLSLKEAKKLFELEIS